ncbi:MAG: exonuclease, partial [Suipraeoptans intestinalis]|nr:exonuclease [Suipraeoptans intestinalis]
EALGRAEIEPEGRFHDGLDDAVNTGYLIEKLELNPEYQLVRYKMPEKETERLSCTLGELFSRLNLQLA